MSNESANYVCFAVVLTVVICMFLFLRKEEEPNEIGRYAWSQSGLSVLDTADGTIYVVEEICDKHLTIVMTHLPTGLLTSRKVVDIQAK